MAGTETGSLVGIYNVDNMPADMIRNVMVLPTAQSYMSNATLANIPGFAAVGNLSASNAATGNLTAGATYRIRGHLQGTAASSGGIKISLAGSSCTVTSMSITTWNYNGTTLNAVTTCTALANNLMANAAVYTDLIIDGVIVVNASGTLQLQGAQNTSNATPSTITALSYLEIERVA